MSIVSTLTLVSYLQNSSVSANNSFVTDFQVQFWIKEKIPESNYRLIASSTSFPFSLHDTGTLILSIRISGKVSQKWTSHCPFLDVAMWSILIKETLKGETQLLQKMFLRDLKKEKWAPQGKQLTVLQHLLFPVSEPSHVMIWCLEL